MRRPRLHRHKTGQWRARINGRDVYYGTDYHKALARFYRDLSDTHPLDAEEATILDAVLYYRGLKPHDSNRDWQLRPLLAYAGARYLASLPRSFLTDYANWLRGKSAPSTLAKRVRLAIAVLRSAQELGWLRRLPSTPRLDRPAPRYRDLPPARIPELIQQVADSRRGWYADILRFLTATGCRPSEACNLRWEWVDLEGKVCRIPEHKTAHQARIKVIYLTAPAVDLLRFLGEKPSGPVFVGPDGRPTTARRLGCACRHRNFHPYQLRHSFAQAARQQGVALDELQVLLGHSHIATTQIYAQVRDHHAAEVARSLVPPTALLPEGSPDGLERRSGDRSAPGSDGQQANDSGH